MSWVFQAIGDVRVSLNLFLQLLRYGVTGLSSVAVYIIGLSVLVHVFRISHGLANLVAYLMVTVMNYLLHFYWSFASSRPHSQASWRFLMVVAAGIVVNTLTVGTLVALGVSVEMAALAFSAFWPLVSFAGLKYWALR